MEEDRYYVYVLEDENGKRYKGMTSNLERRLSEHKSGRTHSTSRMCNIKLVYKEECKSREEARNREIYLKTAAGRRFIRKVLGV